MKIKVRGEVFSFRRPHPVSPPSQRAKPEPPEEPRMVGISPGASRRFLELSRAVRRFPELSRAVRRLRV